MARLSIRILGPFQVHLDGEPVSAFVSDKVRALLAYLALTPGRPHRREALAGLLWPEFPERSARTNLRNALANLRHVLGERARSGGSTVLPPFLLSTRQTVQFDPDSEHWLDADAFEALVSTAPPSEEVLEQAVGLVRGPFLEGFTLAGAAPFEEWLLLRREYYGRLIVKALGCLAALYEGQGAYEDALAHARRRVELEPWEEDGQRQVMRLLAQIGHRTHALAQYEALCRSLQEELGAGPSPETRALYERILSGNPAPEVGTRQDKEAPLWKVPRSPIPFFGRAEEFASLEGRLSEPGTRLVNVTGMGGSGKTRLALEVSARLVERDRQALSEGSGVAYPHGIVFVPLVALDSIEGLDAALAQALEVHLEGGRHQLLAYLSPRRLLLILDNLEHLPGASGCIDEILRFAPGVKILATSRERLRLQGEGVITLDGLPCPASDLEERLEATTDHAALLSAYPALQLLAHGIHRVRAEFSPGAAELRAMVAICRQVDGLPLALELAASWADTLSVEDIQAETQQSLGFLQVDWPGLPERQRSIRATFDVSWQRLSPAEQALFSSLTVFRGGFTREAAGQVVLGAGAVPRLLATLVRKSMLHYHPLEDRYQIHALLRQYGAEKLAQGPARASEAFDRHSAYYSDALRRWERELFGSREQAALSEMEIESDNMLAAWDWAVGQSQIARLDQGISGLNIFFRESGRQHQARASLAAAAGAAGAVSKAAADNSALAMSLRVQARALAMQSNVCRELAEHDRARQLQQQCRAILEHPVLSGQDVRLERAVLASALGLTIVMADTARARKHYQESYALYRDLDHRQGMALLLYSWGIASARLGDHEDARQQLDQCLAICKASGSRSGVAWSLSGLAYLARVEGRFEQSEALSREAYLAAQEAGAQHLAGRNLAYHGKALLYVGQFPEAYSVTQQSLALFNGFGHRSFATQVQAILGRICMHWGRYEKAREHAETALAVAREQGPGFTGGLSLLLLGCLDLAEGAPARAQQYLHECIAVYRKSGPEDELIWGYAALAIAELHMEDEAEARKHVYLALRIAVDMRCVPRLLWALAAGALLLASQGQNEHAVELYALASRFPFVAKSSWFEAAIGRHIAARAATMPEHVISAARERGRALDLGATVEELVAALRA